ncbi:hypothetical protein ACQ4LE_010657 [Meloidogyne hapla]
MSKLINSDKCLQDSEDGCDNGRYRCCKGTYCQPVKDTNIYVCSKNKCKTDGQGCKSNNDCCFGTKCKSGKCQKCSKDGGGPCYNDGDCCTGLCDVIFNQCY